MSDVEDAHIDELIGRDEPDAEIVEEEAAPEAEPEVEGGDEQEDQLRGNLGVALREAREATKAERAQREMLQQKFDLNEKALQRLEQRLAELSQPKPAEPDAPQIPKYEEDPEGYYQGTIAAMQKQIADLAQHRDRQTQQVQQQTESNQMLEQYASAVRDYKAQPEAEGWDDAYQHLWQTRADTWKQAGFDDAAFINNVILQEEGFIVREAMNRGINPAKALHTFAKAMGYQKAEPESEIEPEKKPLPDNITRLRNGQFASKSLGGPKGRSETEVTLQALADAEPGPEFDALWEKARRKGIL